MLDNAPRLAVHCIHSHKVALEKIPNALSHRCSPNLAIYGMDGIPHEDLQEYQIRKRDVQPTANQTEGITLKPDEPVVSG